MAGIPKKRQKRHVSSSGKLTKSRSSKDDTMSIAAYDQDRPSLLPPSLLGDPDHRTRSLGGIADSGARLTLTEIKAGADHYGRRFRFKIRATARIQRAKVAPMTSHTLVNVSVVHTPDASRESYQR